MTKFSLADRAMTVGLHLSMWNGQRIDQTATAEVLASRQATSDAGHFRKHLVPPKSLQGVIRAHSRARQKHYQMSLPWGEESVRILSAEAFFEYTAAMQEERENCEKAHREFLQEYPSLVATAPERLGKMYRESEFPSVEELEKRFAFRLNILPVPDSGDFRVNLGAEIEEQIRKDIERTVSERYVDAQKELYERLLDTAKHFAGTMWQEDKIFRNSTVTKLVDIARIIPKMSLVPDPKLEGLCSEILEIVDGVDPDLYRNDKGARQSAATKAQDAVRKIEASLQGAF